MRWLDSVQVDRGACEVPLFCLKPTLGISVRSAMPDTFAPPRGRLSRRHKYARMIQGAYATFTDPLGPQLRCAKLLGHKRKMNSIFAHPYASP